MNLQIPDEDIQWEGEDPGISRRMGHGEPGQGIKKSVGHGSAIPSVGRGRGYPKNETKTDFPTSQNGIRKKGSDDIEILHTDSLIKEVSMCNFTQLYGIQRCGLFVWLFVFFFYLVISIR